MGRAGANHARPHRMRHVRLHRTNQLFLSKTVHDILLYFCQLEKSNFIWSTILSYLTPTDKAGARSQHRPAQHCMRSTHWLSTGEIGACMRGQCNSCKSIAWFCSVF